MKTLNKIVIILAKIAEVCCWVACGFMLLGAVFVAIGSPVLLKLIGNFDLFSIATLDAFGFHVIAGNHFTAVYIIFFITSLLCAGLWAMICRNVYLIFKTAAGETKFSTGVTPFQSDNVRMVREIGIFMIAVPVIQLIAGGILTAVCGPDAIEQSVGLTGVFAGLVVLCLSQYFAYGKQLQDENDGLL